MPWTEHPGAGAVLGAAKCSVVGISLAGCVCTQCLFMGNASFHVIYSPRGFGLVSLSVGLKGDRALVGSCCPGGPLNSRMMRSPKNRDSVGEREQNVSTCGCPNSGTEEGRTPEHGESTEKTQGQHPNITPCLPQGLPGDRDQQSSPSHPVRKGVCEYQRAKASPICLNWQVLCLSSSCKMIPEQMRTGTSWKAQAQTAGVGE